MKKIIFLIMLFMGLYSQAQTGEPLLISDVVKISDSTKSAKQLQASAKMWFTNTFKDPKEVILLDDVENGILVGRAIMAFQSNIFMGGEGRTGVITYDIKVNSRKGRYKYEFYNFYHDGRVIDFGLIKDVAAFPELRGMMGGSKDYKEKVTKEILDYIRDRTGSLAVGLKAEMERDLKGSDDW